MTNFDKGYQTGQLIAELQQQAAALSEQIAAYNAATLTNAAKAEAKAAAAIASANQPKAKAQPRAKTLTPIEQAFSNI